MCVSQASSSSNSLDGPCVDYAKSYDAVVFDVLKVTPEEFAVSTIQMSLKFYAAYKMDQDPSVLHSETTIWQSFHSCSGEGGCLTDHLKELYQRY